MEEQLVKKRRRVWTKEEDEKLKVLVEERKLKNWVMISNFFKNRSNKDCRDRYFLHLSPNVVKRKWTEEEEKLLLEKYNEFGSKWVRLTSFFDKRSPNDLKNRIKLIQKRKNPLRKGFLTNSQNSSSDQSANNASISSKLGITINSKLFQNDYFSIFDYFENNFNNFQITSDYLPNLKSEVDKPGPFIASHPFCYDIINQENNIEKEIFSNNTFFINS